MRLCVSMTWTNAAVHAPVASLLGKCRLWGDAGARLAYIPFVCTWAFLVYRLCRLRHDRQPLYTALHGLLLGVGVWLLPFLFKVGWHDIVLAARMNTEGTVYRYGDTLVTAHNYLGRAVQPMSGMCWSMA